MADVGGNCNRSLHFFACLQKIYNYLRPKPGKGLANHMTKEV